MNAQSIGQNVELNCGFKTYILLDKISTYIECSHSSSRVTLHKLELDGHFPKHVLALGSKSSTCNVAKYIHVKLKRPWKERTLGKCVGLITRIVVKFEFEEFSFMDEMIHGPTGLEEFIKLGWGSQPHKQKTNKQSQHLGHCGNWEEFLKITKTKENNKKRVRFYATEQWTEWSEASSSYSKCFLCEDSRERPVGVKCYL